MRNPLETLNARLRRLREEKNISQTAWGKAAGVAQPQVVRWEAGTGEPSIESLRGIAKLLGTTIASLIGDEVPTYAEPRPPTPEEFLEAFIQGSGIAPDRKAALIAVLKANTAEFDGLGPWLNAVGASSPRKNLKHHG